MALLARFLTYNLSFCIVSGLLAWLITWAVVRLLEVRSSSLSFCFFSLPVIKSILVLSGIGVIFPWPTQWFSNLQHLEVHFGQAIVILLTWAIGVSLVYLMVVRKARRSVLQGARPATEVAPRLAAVFETVLDGFQKAPCLQCSDDLCCAIELKSAPRLLVSARIHSPLAITDGGEPVILFPAGLVTRLSDVELMGGLAHEIAHFHLRRPSWCSAGTLQRLTWISPVAGLLGTYLHRQEENACDQLAVAVVGQPEVYAKMLMKSYRYSRGISSTSNWSQLPVLPRLLGFKPLLSERVEHLLQSTPNPQGWKQSRWVIRSVWIILLSILFFNFFIIPT